MKCVVYKIIKWYTILEKYNNYVWNASNRYENTVSN